MLVPERSGFGVRRFQAAIIFPFVSGTASRKVCIGAPAAAFGRNRWPHCLGFRSRTPVAQSSAQNRLPKTRVPAVMWLQFRAAQSPATDGIGSSCEVNTGRTLPVWRIHNGTPVPDMIRNVCVAEALVVGAQPNYLYALEQDEQEPLIALNACFA
jgi:hypothetical protein